MRKVVLSTIAMVSLAVPSFAAANHYNVPREVMMMEYDSEEDCEDALAMVRNAERMSGRYEGRERGMYNKAFNARYQCVETDDDMWMIEDYGS
jgi:hypothetical protein